MTWDRGADGRLEAKLDARAGRGREELRAAAGDQLLVRRDDRLPGREQLEDVAPRRLEAAHDLRDDGDRGVVPDRFELGREDARPRGERALLLGLADERADDADAVPRRPLDVVRVLGEEPVDSSSDRPVSEERDRYVNSRHLAPESPRGSAPAVADERGGASGYGSTCHAKSPCSNRASVGDAARRCQPRAAVVSPESGRVPATRDKKHGCKREW